MAVQQNTPSNKGVQKIVTYTMKDDGKKAGDHEKLDEYLLQGYLVIDIFTNSIASPNRESFVSVTVLLSNGNSSDIYKPQ
jgi:hypothetical protein